MLQIDIISEFSQKNFLNIVYFFQAFKGKKPFKIYALNSEIMYYDKRYRCRCKLLIITISIKIDAVNIEIS